MRKFVLIALSVFAAVSAYAQDIFEPRRLPLEHIGDYTEIYGSMGVSGQRRVGSRVGAPLPCMGSPKIPVLLVQFPDRKFTVGADDESVKTVYENFCNGNGFAASDYTKMSVCDYFKAQSDGKFTPEFDIIGPITLDNGYAYYGKDTSSNMDVNILAFYTDACKKAMKEHGVKWDDYDNNSDGIVDFVYFIYAGKGQNETGLANDIWPKEVVRRTTITVGDVSFVIAAFGCTNELYRDNIDGIGTMCHELSHGLGLPDFYDVIGDNYGMDAFDIMDVGSYQINGTQPCEYSAYERDFMGWRSLVTLDTDKNYSLKLDPIEEGGYGYKIVNENNPNEYIILENRQNRGFDTDYGWLSNAYVTRFGKLHGMLVTYVDYSASVWSNNKVNADVMHMTPIAASGKYVSCINGYNKEWAEALLGVLYPGSQNVTDLCDIAMRTGGVLQQEIYDIKETADGIITCEIVNPSVPVARTCTLTDGIAYTNMEEKVYEELSYTRNFTNTQWQALYVPFSMTYDDWKEEYEVAKINNVNMYDMDDDGWIDKTVLEIIKVKSGTLKPNYPYLIKAKSAGEHTITLTDATLYGAEISSPSCSSMEAKFTFIGTYTGVSGQEMADNKYYALSSGSLCYTESSSFGLKPYRWYMVTENYGSQLINPTSEVRVRVYGEPEDATEIVDVEVKKEHCAPIFTIDGRVANKDGNRKNLGKGVYFQGGRKFVVM